MPVVTWEIKWSGRRNMTSPFWVRYMYLVQRTHKNVSVANVRQCQRLIAGLPLSHWRHLVAYWMRNKERATFPRLCLWKPRGSKICWQNPKENLLKNFSKAGNIATDLDCRTGVKILVMLVTVYTNSLLLESDTFLESHSLSARTRVYPKVSGLSR
jgi:hypothetical protein